MRILNDEEIKIALNKMLQVPDNELPTAYEVVAKAQQRQDLKDFMKELVEIMDDERVLALIQKLKQLVDR